MWSEYKIGDLFEWSGELCLQLLYHLPAHVIPTERGENEAGDEN